MPPGLTARCCREVPLRFTASHQVSISRRPSMTECIIPPHDTHAHQTHSEGKPVMPLGLGVLAGTRRGSGVRMMTTHMHRAVVASTKTRWVHLPSLLRWICEAGMHACMQHTSALSSISLGQGTHMHHAVRASTKTRCALFAVF